MRRASVVISTISLLLCATVFAGAGRSSERQQPPPPPSPVASTAAASLKGVWTIVSMGRGVAAPPMFPRIKVYTDRTWYILQTDPASGAVMYHLGGTYTQTATNDVETTRYSDANTAWFVGDTVAFAVSTAGDQLTLKADDHTEIWTRASADVVAALRPEPAVASARSVPLPQGFDGPRLARACERTPRGAALRTELGSSAGRGVPLAEVSAEERLQALTLPDPDDAAAVIDLARCYYSQRHTAASQRLLRQAGDAIRRRESGAPQAPDPRPSLRVGSAVTYPDDARRLGITGVVFVEATVSDKGSVTAARIVGSVPEFDALALSAVRSWSFSAAQANGKSVETHPILKLKFAPTPEVTPEDAMDVARFWYHRQAYADAAEAIGQAIGLIDAQIIADRECSGSTANVPKVGGTITEPRKIRDQRPVYPKESQSAKEQGLVILEATIASTGRVCGARVVRSVTPRLDEAAVTAVQGWVYTPTLLNGAPTPVMMTVTVNFTLQ